MLRAKFCSRVSFYIGHDGLLYHLGDNRKRNSWDSFSQLVVPPTLRFEILSNMHDHVSGAHFGVHKTFNKVKQRYWWKGMYKDIELGVSLVLNVP